VLTRTLVKLSEDGLIARNAGHGWRFLQTLNSDVALRNSYGFRLMIEPTALLTPNLHVDRQMLKRLRARHLRLITHPDITQVPAKEIFETDADFTSCWQKPAATCLCYRPFSNKTGCAVCWNLAAITISAA
jgi:DNA-binding GntR family transcriptional regulator